MSKRMTDERMAEIVASRLMWNSKAIAEELLQALKAERQEVGRLRGIERQYTLLVTAPDTTERKLARLVNGWDRMFPMFDLEPESEFRRGQLCGWNQCISQVQELFDQAIGEQQ